MRTRSTIYPVGCLKCSQFVKKSAVAVLRAAHLDVYIIYVYTYIYMQIYTYKHACMGLIYKRRVDMWTREKDNHTYIYIYICIQGLLRLSMLQPGLVQQGILRQAFSYGRVHYAKAHHTA